MNNRTATSFIGKCTAMLVVALALACTVFALPAFANKQLDAPTTVSDDITRVHVAKLDADTHDYVIGAKMAIIDEETGQVVDEWISGSGVHEYEKGSLVVERVYILRELEAPEGFDKVDDVRFVVNEMEGSGLTILSGTNDQFELTESYKINLYDKPHDTENVITTTKPASSTSTPTRAAAPKTGDETPMITVGILVLAGILAIALLQLSKGLLRKKE